VATWATELDQHELPPAAELNASIKSTSVAADFCRNGQASIDSEQTDVGQTIGADPVAGAILAPPMQAVNDLFWKIFPRCLRSARERQGLTQAEIAERLGETQFFISSSTHLANDPQR
jgi:hypothetical protein